MHRKLCRSIVSRGGAAAALALLCGGAVADDGSSLAFVMATDDDVAAVEASDLVIHVTDDAPAPAVTAPATARGSLTVVANGGQRAPVGACITDAAVRPASGAEARDASGRGWGALLGGGPRRPSPQAGLQSPRASGGIPAGRQPQFAPANQPPPAYESAPAPVAPQVQVKSAVEHAQTLLVQAHQLSLTAQHEAEYSQIIQWCAAASRATLDEESQQFGAQLSAWALNRRGQHRADDGQTELAQADFRAALEFDAGNWRALHNRAVTLAQEGHFADAFDDLSRVIDLNPQFAKAWANRATLYVQAGQLDRALADYDAALAADAALVPALVGRGRLCHAQGRLEEALANLNDAVKQQPHDAQILCSRADLLSDLGRYEEALSDYATAIDVDGRLEHAFRNGAWLLATCPVDDIRDVEGALVGAQAALECGYGERHAALDTLAAAYANAGRFAEAVGTIQQALEIAPAELQAAYQARLALYESGRPYRTTPVSASAVGPAGAEQPAAYAAP